MAALDRPAAVALTRSTRSPPRRPRSTPRPAFPGAASAALQRRPARSTLAARRRARRNGRPCARSPRADGSVGRLYEGHLNAVERLARRRPRAAAHHRARRIAGGELRLGVWGADPAAGRGRARAARQRRRLVHGVKVFCSGAGGLDRALVIAARRRRRRRARLRRPRGRRGRPRRGTARGGMRASESHRVLFHGAPVLAAARRAGRARPRAVVLARRDPHRRRLGRASPTPPRTPRSRTSRARPELDDLRALAAGAHRHGAARRSTAGSSTPPRAPTRTRTPTCATSRPAARRRRRRRRARSSTRRPARAARARSPPARRSTARAATSSCSCSSTGSTRWSRALGRDAVALAMRPRLGRRLLRRALRGATPIRGTSRRARTSAAKYDATIAALDGRRYADGARARLLDRRAHRSGSRRHCDDAARRRRLRGGARQRARAARPRASRFERREMPGGVPGRAAST